MIILYLLLLIIPGILCALSYAVVNQIVMLEGLSGSPALERSAELTRGSRGRIFGILLLLNILVAIFSAGLGLVLKGAFPPGGDPVLGARGLEYTAFQHPGYEINKIAEFLVQMVAGAYGAICVTLIYFDLRVRKEGFDLEVAARQQLLAVDPATIQAKWQEPGKSPNITE